MNVRPILYAQHPFKRPEAFDKVEGWDAQLPHVPLHLYCSGRLTDTWINSQTDVVVSKILKNRLVPNGGACFTARVATSAK
jgi:hypothetical protein